MEKLKQVNNYLGMTMRMMTAKDSFGLFLDSVQHEPVVVTKRDRPVGVMFSMNDLPAMPDFVDTAKECLLEI